VYLVHIKGISGLHQGYIKFTLKGMFSSHIGPVCEWGIFAVPKRYFRFTKKSFPVCITGISSLYWKVCSVHVEGQFMYEAFLAHLKVYLVHIKWISGLQYGYINFMLKGIYSSHNSSSSCMRHFWNAWKVSYKSHFQFALRIHQLYIKRYIQFTNRASSCMRHLWYALRYIRFT
jgi:hypothetical protein